MGGAICPDVVSRVGTAVKEVVVPGEHLGSALGRGRVAWLRVQGSGFRVQGSGFRVEGSGFRVEG